MTIIGVGTIGILLIGGILTLAGELAGVGILGMAQTGVGVGTTGIRHGDGMDIMEMDFMALDGEATTITVGDGMATEEET